MRRTILSAFILPMLLGAVTFWSSAASQAAEGWVDPPAEAGGNAAVPTPIKFNFKGATFDQVIDYFSRATGLPVIWKTPAPEGTLDYISPHEYSLPEGLRILNIILQSKGVMLRVDNDKLHLQKLEQMQREDIPTFVGTIPEQVTSDQIVTVVRPLTNALAKPLAERLANMVAAYGSVIAMEQQNALVITETAANVRRVLSILDQLDRQDPEGAVEIFRIKHAKATELMTPLKSLLSQKVERFVINAKGEQVKIEEEQLAGLSISADDRTNSIVAKGSGAKLANLRETIALLDVPANGQSRSMTTMALQRTTPAEAVAKLNQLYQRRPEKERPTVVALDDALKVMIIGDDAAIMEGGLLLSELENGPIGAAGSENIASLIVLEHAPPAGVINAMNNLLSRRQLAAVKLVAGADGQSIIVSGTPAEVEAAKALVPLLDQGTATAGDVQVLTITNADAGQVAGALDALFNVPGMSGGASQSKPFIRVDGASNSLLIRATATQLQTIQEVVAKIDQASVASSRQMRLVQIDSTKATAQEMADLLLRMLDQQSPGGGRIEVISLEELLKRREESSRSAAGPGGATP